MAPFIDSTTSWGRCIWARVVEGLPVVGLGPTDVLEKTQWKDYWNEDIVSEARQSLADPTVMTVLLTGRRTIPFYPLISRMLASKQLHFDLLGLRPDPTKEIHEDHVNSNVNNNNNNNNDMSYGASSVFINTLDFKTCFILNILHNVPSINAIKMWDDRAPHVKKFQHFLETLTSQSLINHGLAKHVTPVRPCYRPKWERRVVTHVLESHNANELLYREKQRWNRNINMITWEAHHLLEDEENSHDDILHHHPSHCLTKVAKHLSLGHIPSSTIVRLDQSSVKKLRAVFQPFYTSQLKMKNQQLTGWRANAEVPLWFGHQIVLFPNILDHHRLESYGGLGMKVKFVIRSISKPDPQIGMVALVDVYPDLGPNSHHTPSNDRNCPAAWKTPKKYILPLMYRPSQANTISRKTFQWTRLPNGHQHHYGFGEIALSHLLGLDGTVKDDEEHQLVCLDEETKSTVLGKRSSID
ncbi:unnamed protein product [Absidia cylindrospora]